MNPVFWRANSRGGVRSDQERPTLVIQFVEEDQWLGGSLYIDNLLAALSALPLEFRPMVRLQMLSSPRTPLARKLINHSIVVGVTDSWAASLVSAVRRIHRAMLRRAPWIGHLSIRSDNQLYFPVFDAKEPRRTNLYWIPDLQPHYLPELFDADELVSRMDSFLDIANSRGVLLLSSGAALEDFKKFYPSATVEPRVWSFCSSIQPASSTTCEQVMERYGLPGKFVYIANQFWKHKDHETAFRALKLLHDQGVDVPVVCTGLQYDRRAPSYFTDLIEDLERHGLKGHVHFLGVLPREEQVQLFRAAAIVLQPSRFEGWSTVIEDAKALGRPVLASDIPVHNEQVAGESNALLFRTSDASDLAERLAEAWPGLRAGPDIEQEALAITRRDARRLDAAHRFVVIVNEALAYSRHESRQSGEQT